MPPDLVSTTLLTRLRNQEPQAWERAARIFAPLIVAWCQRQGVTGAAAEDVVQDVFTAVAKNLVTFRRDRPGDSFRGWLATITHNKIRDHYRRQGKQPLGEGGSTHLARIENEPDINRATMSLDSRDDGDERLLIIRRAAELVRGEFEPTTWDAFFLTTTEELPPQVAAERLGISVNAVYKARSRVLRRLREELDGLI